MRNSTENIYREKVNQVIDYIGANLHRPLQLDLIAGKIHVSQRQLLRIMHSALDESLYSYITRQRLERAVLYMQTGEITLAGVAAKVGYENPQSFSKAFKMQFGIAPKTYLAALRSRLEQAVSLHGTSNSLLSEVLHFEGLDLVYIRIFGKYGADAPYTTAWNKLTGFLQKNQALTPGTRFIGLSFDDPHVTCTEQCRFYACASVNKQILPSGDFGVIRLQPGKYAVYMLQGSYTELQIMYNAIQSRCEHTLRRGMPFEEYIRYSNADGGEQLTKIYIPIK